METCWSLLSLSRKCLEVCKEQNYNLSNVANFAMSTMFDFTVALRSHFIYFQNVRLSFLGKILKIPAQEITVTQVWLMFLLLFLDWNLFGEMVGLVWGRWREWGSGDERMGQYYRSHRPEVLAPALLTGTKKSVFVFNYKLYFQAYRKFLKKPVQCLSQCFTNLHINLLV